MCRRVLVSAVNPPPRPLQANLAGSRGLFARSQIWLTRCEYCSHWPGLRTAGCARPQAILGCEATCIRSRIVESQPWRSRDLGPKRYFGCSAGDFPGASAALSAPTRVRPAHPARGVHPRGQRRVAPRIWRLDMAARVVFVPELGTSGRLFQLLGRVARWFHHVDPLLIHTDTTAQL